jgi:hypothetical protein
MAVEITIHHANGMHRIGVDTVPVPQSLYANIARILHILIVVKPDDNAMPRRIGARLEIKTFPFFRLRDNWVKARSYKGRNMGYRGLPQDVA